MLPVVYYFLQVILCSGIMMGYYWLVLRNKRFHQYNRFYLLVVALLSWIVPLVKIQWGHSMAETDPQMIQFLSIVADNNTQIESSFIHKGFIVDWSILAMVVYAGISLLMLAGMIRALYRIYQLLAVHSCRSMGDIYLILTQAKGTPFSFFRYIFWNEQIDIRSEAGKQIMEHELTHVRQKHSFDKIYIQLVLIVGWLNPFFWLMKREMEMIHEFMADHKAVEKGDAATLAQMILAAAYPKQQFAMTNPFFFSPIKRRLLMLTNTRNPRFSYFRRLVVLPLLAVVVVLFAFRKKEERTNTSISVGSVVQNVVSDVIRVGTGNNQQTATFDEAILDKDFTVVIDASHGGKDKGAMAEDGTSEASLTLLVAKKIRELNQNPHIQIVLRRTTDVFEDAPTVVHSINKIAPDLMLSLHVNSPKGAWTGKGVSPSGIEIYIPNASKAADYKGSVALANYLNHSLTGLQEKMLGIKSRTAGIWMLDQVSCPAVLLETGFMTNTADLKKLKDPAYQTRLANSILQGINDFLSKPVQTGLNLAKIGVDTIIIKQDGSKNLVRLNDTPQKNDINKALIILDGNVITQEIMNLIDPDKIASVDVLKGESAVALYGDKAGNGVVVINTKKQEDFKPRFPKSIQFTRHPSANSRGTQEYIDSVLQLTHHEPDLSFRNPDGTAPLIMVDGKKSDLKAINPNTITSVNVLKGAYATRQYGEEGRSGVVEITTVNSEKIFTATDVPPSFPGGKNTWEKYLQRNLKPDMIRNAGGPPGTYVVVVSFIVDENGKVSNVVADNDPGYGTRAESERVIRTGPDWIPAKQNGINVSCRYKQKITWWVSEKKEAAGHVSTRPDLYPVSGKQVNNTGMQTEAMLRFQEKLAKAMEGNTKTFFNIDGQSCVVTGKGNSASFVGNTDWIIVNGKKITTGELNRKYTRNEFIMVAANDTRETLSKYGHGLLLVSDKYLSKTEVRALLN